MVVGAALHSQQDRYGVSGILQHPIPKLHNQSPWNPSQLWRVQHCILHFPWHRLQKGGLITTHQNELYYGVANLAGKAFTPLHVHDDPLIYPGHAVREGKDLTKNLPSLGDKMEQKGDLLVQNLWQRGIDSIHDMYTMNTSDLYYH